MSRLNRFSTLLLAGAASAALLAGPASAQDAPPAKHHHSMDGVAGISQPIANIFGQMQGQGTVGPQEPPIQQHAARAAFCSPASTRLRIAAIVSGVNAGLRPL